MIIFFLCVQVEYKSSCLLSKFGDCHPALLSVFTVPRVRPPGPVYWLAVCTFERDF